MSKLPKLLNFLKMKMKILGVRRFIFLLLSLTALTEDVHTRIMTKKCMSGADCGEGYICNEGICHSCLDCALLFRDGPSCVMDFKQCGSCLKGFKDFPITDFSTVIKPCEKIEIKAYSQECLNDHHCPFGNYCHEKLCVNCFDCSLYNRLPPTQNCAKEPQDCSSCLNGFYEVPVTTETNTKPCQKITSHSIENVNYRGSESAQNFALAILCLFGILVCGVLLLRRQAGSSKQMIEVQCHSPRPPPYPSDVCQYVREPEPEVEEESSFFTFVEEEKQQANTAKVFRLPQAPYYYENEDEIDNLTENPVDDEEEDGNFNVVYLGSNINLFSHSTETDSVTTPPQEVDDFEVVSESEINMASLNDVNITDSTSTDATNAVEESPLEESKSPNEEEGVEQKEEKDLTE